MSSTGQISNLRPLTRHITTHDPTTGHATVHSSSPATWNSIANDSLGFHVAYTTSSMPANLTDEADLRTHEELMKPPSSLGLVNPGGTVCRIVDFAPDSSKHPPIMHRTQSLDYGIVLEGEIEMQLDSGDVRRMGRGDIAVQRGTMHAWRNPSETEWARMVFVLQSIEPVVVGGKELGEDLSTTKGEDTGIPPSESGQ